MIVGIGVDSVELERMTERLAKKILTEQEQRIFMTKMTLLHKQQFLAGRFAAKEAYAKACGTGIGEVKFQDLSILNDDLGAPFVYLHGQTQANRKVHLSLTHDTIHATAFVIIEE